ncbi:MAG: hypothetical protein ACKO3C_05380, partial [Betaproteobacteria bacterium]
GQGTFTYSNGNKYVGKYRDDKRNGQGTLTFIDGRKHVGEWRDDKIHGQGTLTFPNGEKYVGEWRDDKIQGQGIEYRADGSANRSGRWENKSLVQPYPIDTNRFPFNPSSQVAAAPAVDSASAQSSLPPCPASGVKNNCFGFESTETGVTRYVGEFRNGNLHGLGVWYRAGNVVGSGRWINGVFVEQMPLDTNRFPFNPPSQVAAAPAVDPVRAERERLAAEAEAERRRRPELEQRLLAEAQERERQAAESEQKKRIEAEAHQAAELEAERRKRQELEERLAQAKERERVLVEAKEREKVATLQRPQAALKPDAAQRLQALLAAALSDDSGRAL